MTVELPHSGKRGRDPPVHVLLDRFKLGEHLGKGAYGTVVRVKDTWCADGIDSDCAMKVFHPIDGHDDEVHDEVMQEANVLNYISKYPSVAHHFPCLRAHGRNFVVMDYLAYPTLKQSIKKTGARGMPIDRIQTLGLGMLHALSALHNMGLIHRDIKPDNVMCTAKSAIIIDFGLTVTVDPSSPSAKFVQSTWTDTPYAVTRPYRAPEIILELPQTTAVDVWAWGCCLMEMFAGCAILRGMDNWGQLECIINRFGTLPPSMTDRTTARVTTNVQRAETNARCGNVFWLPQYIAALRPSDVSITKEMRPLFVDMISHMLALDPALRWTAAQCIEHEFWTVA